MQFMKEKIHTFDNGVKIFDYHLTDFQRGRYQKHNVHESEEEEIFVKVMSNVPDAGCFLNIGAAVGYYSILAKKLVPSITVHAVEPLEQHRKFFYENIALNGFKPKDFILHKDAIALCDGTDYLLDQDYGSMLLNEHEKAKSLVSSIKTRIDLFIKNKDGNENEKKKIRVRTITLDHLIKVVDKIVDLIVMDVQGLEGDVLRGGQQSLKAEKVKTILIGTHSAAIHLQCIDLLKTYGFKIEYENQTPKEQPDGILLATYET